MDKLADLRDSGMGIDQVYAWANDHRLELHHWFFSTDLSFYVKGGRISKPAGWFGTVLKICPLLNMDSLGRLIPRQKLRGKKNAVKEIVDRMEEHAQGGLDYDGKCYISQSACYEDARAVADMVEARFPKLNGRVEIYSVGTTIGSHTGPGTVALFFWGTSGRIDTGCLSHSAFSQALGQRGIRETLRFCPDGEPKESTGKRRRFFCGAFSA